MLAAVDGDPLDRAVGAYLAGRNTAETASGKRQVIAVDRKSLRGSARLSAGRRHLLSAVTHHRALTLAQAEVGAKTNETAHFRPLLESLGLDGTLITFDALHSVQANVTWLVETKNAHYIAMIKRNQPTAYRQLAALPWRDIAVQHTASCTGTRPPGVPLRQDLRHHRRNRRDRLPPRPPRPPRPPTPHHGHLPQPRHRPAQNPRSHQHRQDHPGNPRPARTSPPTPGHHQQP